jgi:hypothetical protein
MDFWIGVDLGSHVDFSAVSVLERSLAIDQATKLPLRNTRGYALYRWRLRGLHRFPLRTPYPEIARKVARIASLSQLRPSPRVVCDSTGVGVATTEQIRTAMLPYPDVEVWGVSITSGEGWRAVRRLELNCSKIQLVGSFREVLDAERFKVAFRHDGKPIRGADVLKRELRAFKVKTTSSQNEVFGADSGHHDDCVLSVSLPVWVGSLPYLHMRERLEGDDDPGFYAREAEALSAEEKAIQEDEAEALARERGEVTERMKREREELRRIAAADPWDDRLWA